VTEPRKRRTKTFAPRLARERRSPRRARAPGVPARGETAPAVVRPVRSGLPFRAGPRRGLGGPASGVEPAPRVTTPAVQRAPAGAPAAAAAPASLPSPVAPALARAGGGEPLRPSLRHRLEPQVGADLSTVRVHTGPSARSASRALQARAFTVGRDIWLGKGESPEDLALMAHEATHVVQQTARPPGHLAEPTIQRAATPSPKTWKEGKAEVDTENKKMVVPKLSVPKEKARRMRTRPIRLRNLNTDPAGTKKKMATGERETKQAGEWDKAARAGGANTHFDNLITDAQKKKQPLDIAGAPTYFFKTGRGKLYLIGEKAKIRDRALRPVWDDKGAEHFFDVDHVQEYQLMGPDVPSNYWLWDSAANQSSGSSIKNAIDQAIQGVLSDAKPTLARRTPTFAGVRKNYEVVFDSLKGDLGIGGQPDVYWMLDQVTSGKHLKPLKPMTEKDIDKVRGSDTELVIFTASTGGQRFSHSWKPNQTTFTGTLKYYDNFVLDEIVYNGDGTGVVHGTAFPSHPKIKSQPLEAKIAPMPAVMMGGYIDGRGIAAKLRSIEFKGLSPIEIDSAELVTGKGIVIRGRIKASVPPIQDTYIDLTIDGNDVTLSKTFSTDEIQIPGPVQVTGSSLTVGGGTKGIEVSGQVDFEIPRAGKGTLEGKGRSRGGFSIAGDFEFDPTLFDPPSKVSLTYSDGAVTGKGKLTLGKKRKLKGIKRASVEVEVEDRNWKALGEVEPDIPGVSEGSLEISFQEGKGLTIAGKLTLSGDIPRLKSGSIEARIEQRGEEWKVAASGSAALDIPGVQTASVDASYDDGEFTAVGNVAFEKGMLKGNVRAGLTNRPVGDDGKPAGEAAPGAKDLTPFGYGSVTLRIAPWLEGTIGIRLKPDGEVEVQGKIALPSALEIFPEKKLDKEIFSIGVDIPIFGVAVAGQRIGIFANITGSLSASAGIGPGELRDLNVEVTYNPADEAATRVSGGARFVIPAHAGLKLAIRGGIGAGIPVVSAQVGLEAAGQLGIEGAAEAAATVEWTPATGIKLDAYGRIFAEPKLKFTLSGFALVEADLVLTTVELYRENWQLASMELGSGLKFEVKFPVHYREGEPFNLSLSDVEFIVPKIDTTALLKNLMSQVV